MNTFSVDRLNRVRRSAALKRVVPLVLYVALALATTWPLPRAPLTRLPIGTEPVFTVAMFNLWTIWWNADRARHGWNDYWHAPIFYPEDNTFAFSEPQPVTTLVAPVLWLSGSRVLAFNVYLWLSLVLNGVFTERLLRLAGLRRPFAVGGAAAMILLPIVHWQLGVLQLVPLWGILWTWTALLKLSRRASIARGAELGAAIGVSFLTSAHHGLFLAVLVAGSAWILREWFLRPRTWLAWLTAGAVAALLAGPVVLKLNQVVARDEYARQPETVAQLSAVPGDYLAAPGKQLINTNEFAPRPYWRLSPGWIKIGLAVLGLAIGLIRRRWRRWTAFVLATAVLAFLLSLGPNLRIRDWQPWWALTQVCPGFSQVRNVFRFAFFVQMATVLLAAQAVYGLWLLNRRFLGSSRWCYATGAALAALGLAAVFEVLPTRPKLAAVPDAAAHAGWIEFVREHTPPGRAVACIPFAGGNAVEDFEVTTRWMYFGTFHRVPLVNGYSGFFPARYFEIRDAVHASFPSADSLAVLAQAGAEFLIINRSAVAAEIPESATFGSMQLRRVLRDGTGVDIYRLQQSSRPMNAQYE